MLGTTDDQLEEALQAAYAYLNSRDRTEAEIRRRLEQRGIDDSVIAAALAALHRHGALDDARFTRLFIEDKRRLEQWGAERIRRTLRDRGIDRELIEHALGNNHGGNEHVSNEHGGDGHASNEHGESELDRALAVLRRRFPTPPRERRERDRALGVLLRKGYDSEIALNALSAYTRDADDA